MSLMFGQISADLIEAIGVDRSGILGPSALRRVDEEDQATRQRVASQWSPINSRPVAFQKIAELLRDNMDCLLHHNAGHTIVTSPLSDNSTFDFSPFDGDVQTGFLTDTQNFEE